MTLVASMIRLARRVRQRPRIPWSTGMALGMLLGIAQGAALGIAWLDPMDGTLVGMALGAVMAAALHTPAE